MQSRLVVIDVILCELTGDDAQTLIAHPAYLGLLAEAHCRSGILHLPTLVSALSEMDCERLGACVLDALASRATDLA
jgi:hypothetical protein